MIRAQEVQARLTEHFGPIGEPIEWYGMREHGIAESLEPYPHLINREGVFSEIQGQASDVSATAYFTARLTRARQEEATTYEIIGADMTDFGYVATVGHIPSVEAILGRPFATGLSRTETSILKACFVSPRGMIAIARQALRGQRAGYIVNKSGFAELAIGELLPDVKAIVAERTAFIRSGF